MKIENYLDIITSQHRDKPKYTEMLSMLFEKVKDVNDCLESINSEFSLELAVGKQLDVIAEYVGTSRLLPFQMTSGSSYLSDADLIFIIKSKIAQNQWDGTNEGLEEIWKLMFPDSTLAIYDRQDMTATFLLMSSLSASQIELLTKGILLPKPSGIQYKFIFVTKTLFAYNMETDQLNGYNIGYWEGDFKIFALDIENDLFGGLDEVAWA